MNVKMDKIGTNVIKLEISVEANKFNEAIKKSYFKNSNKYNIPGFRKGKAPMSIIKKYYGSQVFYEDAINFCYEDTYSEAIKQMDIKPVDYPKVDIVTLEEGKDLVYSAEVTVYPEVALGEYKGVEVKKVEYEVKDEDIQKELGVMQNKNSRVLTKEAGNVEKGDIVVMDFKGFIDGNAFEGGEGTNFELEIGSGSFIDTFEDQLVGMAKGENKEVVVKFPLEYGREELNGKEAKFEVKINDIKTKELPKIDDEFAKEVSEFDLLDEYKEDIRKKLVEENKLKTEKEFEESVIDAVSLTAKIEIPEVMIKKEIDNMLKDLENRLKYQGLDLKSYYQYTNSSEEKTREYMKEAAQKRVRIELVLEEISKTEKVEVTKEELMTKATEIAKQYGEKDLEKTTKLLLDAQKNYIEAEVINEKVIKMLVDNSKAIA